MLTCREFADFILAWMEGDLRESERASFEDHIGDCPPCLHYLRTYEETVALGRSLCAADDAPPPQDAPEELVEAILAARRQAGD